MGTREVYKELARLTTKTLLLSLFDVAALFGSFDHRPRYARAYDQYLVARGRDYQRFYQLIYRLKTEKIIEVYGQGKERTIELTKVGRQKITKYLFQNETVPVPKHWDGRWRVVIFDIPNEQRVTRDVVRELLNRVGFYKLQESVYVYPHECISIVRYLEETYDIDKYVQFIVAERIETELDLIAMFHKRGIIRDITRKPKKKPTTTKSTGVH